MRRGETASLRWKENIDLPGRVIKLQAGNTKAKRKIDLPMPDFVYDLLVARRALGNAGGYVFPGRGINPHFTGNVRTFDLILKATGIKTRPHDLRRTFATVAKQAGVSFYDIKAMLNHALPKDPTSGYLIVDAEDFRPAMDKTCERLSCSVILRRSVA